jgi:hypothetical protein
MERIKVKGRIHITLTPAQKRELTRVRAKIAKELPDLIRRDQLAHDARKSKTFSGALRRAVHAFPLAPWKVAEKAGIPWIDLEDFLTGEKPLPSDAIDRLIKVLKLKLPTSKPKPSQRRAKAG